MIYLWEADTVAKQEAGMIFFSWWMLAGLRS